MTQRELDRLLPALGDGWEAGTFGYNSNPVKVLVKRERVAGGRLWLCVDTWNEPSGSHPGMFMRRVLLRVKYRGIGRFAQSAMVGPGRGWAERAAEAVTLLRAEAAARVGSVR